MKTRLGFKSRQCIENANEMALGSNNNNARHREVITLLQKKLFHEDLTEDEAERLQDLFGIINSPVDVHVEYDGFSDQDLDELLENIGFLVETSENKEIYLLSDGRKITVETSEPLENDESKPKPRVMEMLKKFFQKEKVEQHA